VNNLLCVICGAHLQGKQRLFCSSGCRETMKWRRKKVDAIQTKRGVETAEMEHVVSGWIANPMTQHASKGRQGLTFQRLLEDRMFGEILAGKTTISGAAARLTVTPAAVAQAVVAFKDLYEQACKFGDWRPDTDLMTELLGPPTDDETDLGPGDLEELVDSFIRFRDRYFRTEKNEPYITMPFHRRWVVAVLKAIFTGSQILILSPPRHGKTDLMRHVCIWLILRDPNVRILWVAGHQRLAETWLLSIMDELENNSALIEDFCGPGGSFKPSKTRGVMWARSGFTVALRTATGIKSPNMVPVGRGARGSIRSRDCDIIIVDDLEDQPATMQEASRANTRDWWTVTVASRKMKHTGIVYISNRVHPDDLAGHLLENEEWESIVETAHSLDCAKDPTDEEAHIDCMLFPHLNPYSWLMGQQRAAPNRALFELMYLNVDLPDSIRIFQPEEIDHCKSLRIVGDIPTGLKDDDNEPIRVHLYAGLDPADTGYQAAFLWAVTFQPFRMFIVDYENRRGGGLQAAHEQFKDWLAAYDCRHWDIEEVGWQKAIRQSETIRDWAHRNDVVLQGHETTAQNKWDPIYGVGAMTELFRDGTIDIPWGSPESVEKMALYRRQLVYFSSTASQSKHARTGYKSDILMASWFPWARSIRRMRKEWEAEIEREYDPSYPGYDLVELQEPPW
jgi:hypothetical protein